MQIRKDGIYKTINAKDFGIYQAMGFEKVIVEPTKRELKPQGVDKMETINKPVPVIEAVKGIVEEPKEEIVVPKPKKKKKV